MGRNITGVRSGDEPHDRLTQLCADMTRDLPDDVKAIVLLDVGTERKGTAGMVTVGYENDREALTAFRRHLMVFQQARLGAPARSPRRHPAWESE